MDSYVQAWAQLDPDATGIMKNDDELCQLLAMLPEPLRIFEEELPTDRDEKAAALQAISGAHPRSCTFFASQRWADGCRVLCPVGDIALQSRPMGFNTILINRACQVFELSSSDVAAEVPLPRRGVAARPATAAIAAPKEKFDYDAVKSEADAARYVNPMHSSNDKGGAAPLELE